MDNVFSLLDKRILELLQKKNIRKPTEPQKKAIPSILKGKHVLLIAPTGLGKTESALLPIFHNFLKFKKNMDKNIKNKGISILYITPLRALNRDMLQRTIDWGNNLGIKVAVRHGDTPQNERTKQSKNPPDMLITTPETLQILFTGKRLRRYLQDVYWVVVDEVHEIACDERGSQLSVGLERLYEITKKAGHGFQRIGLSATVGDSVEVSKFLGGFEDGVFRDVGILEIDVTKHIDIKVKLPKIKKNDYSMAKRYSIEPISFTLLRICKEEIDRHKSTLLFINTRDGAEILTSRFIRWKEGLKIGVHHGSLSKNARIESENDFKSGKIKSLICTSSLELGIDVGDTDFVIQYNSPREVTRIVQRVGRSGHKIGEISKGLLLTSNAEDLSESLVISRRALGGELESFSVRQNPLSVLSNQIISIALEYGKIESRKVFNIIKRSYPFHSLSTNRFNKIIDLLKSQRNIWIEVEDNNIFIIKRRNSRNYFLDNISMIPDEKTYRVVDIGTRKTIGTLDESFVISSAFEGEKFILQGRPWVIVKREEEQILVSNVKEIGAVPSWVGEDIPVPFEVALEVGKLRRYISQDKNITDYPCDNDTLNQFKNYINNQKKLKFIVPDDKTITIDVDDKNIIINACFGTKVNETLGRLISAILAQSIGESVGINSDAYRISLELPGRISVDKIIDIFTKTNSESLDYLIETILKNSTYIRWQLVHVARKFGSLRKDFDYKNVGIRRLFKLFDQTLIFEEALDKLIWERMDIKNAKLILDKIKVGEISVHVQGLSPIATTGFETIRGLMVPQRADRSILMALKNRLEETNIILICTNCHYNWKTSIKRSDNQPKCVKCGAIKIAVLRRYNQDLIKLFKKGDKKTKDEEKELLRLLKNSSLVLSYGKYALFALMARGVGPDTAARILKGYTLKDIQKSEELEIRFFRDILKAELTYARTRGFWDN